MAKCKTPLKTAEANAKAWLRSKGIIDRFLNILDYKKFVNVQKQLRDNGLEQYNINPIQWEPSPDHNWKEEEDIVEELSKSPAVVNEKKKKRKKRKKKKKHSQTRKIELD